MAPVNFILQLPMTLYKYKWFLCVLFRAGIPRNQTLRWPCETFITGRSKDPHPKEKMEADLGRGRSWMQTQPIPSWALQAGRLLRAVLSWGKRARPLYAPPSTNPWTQAASRKGHGDGWGGFPMKVIPRGIYQLKARSQLHSSKSFSLDR